MGNHFIGSCCAPKVHIVGWRLRIVRMPRNALCRGALRLCDAVRIVRKGQGFASVADDAQTTNPVTKPTFAEFAGFARVMLREGSFLAEIRYGGRERTACLVSECEPRFARFAVRTPAKGGVEFTHFEAKNGHPYSSQYWRGFTAISGLNNGKTATLRFGRRKGPAECADPSGVCSQAIR